MGRGFHSSLRDVFTGIVRERGVVRSVESVGGGGGGGVRLAVAASGTAATVGVGDSVAIDGACLTVVEVSEDTIAFDAVPETLSHTTLEALSEGSLVNVERALHAGDPLGGHFVQGHVDAVGLIRSSDPEGNSVRMWIEAPPAILRYCVEKGSIALDGVSLTIAELADDAFAVALVPHTLVATTLGERRPGDRVNLEPDLLAKYVERLAAPR